jgi:hypothetical protein
VLFEISRSAILNVQAVAITIVGYIIIERKGTASMVLTLALFRNIIIARIVNDEILIISFNSLLASRNSDIVSSGGGRYNAMIDSKKIVRSAMAKNSGKSRTNLLKRFTDNYTSSIYLIHAR